MTKVAAQPSPSFTSDRFMWKLLAVLFAAEFTAAFETTMMYSSIKTFMEVFKNPIGVGWLITGYLLVASAAAAICGRLGDLYGRRRVLLLVLLAAALGSFISAIGSSLAQVIAGRALQGLAGAILPLCYGILRENLEGKRLAYAAGTMGISVTIAAASGLAAGGALAHHFSWNAIFVASGSMALVSFLLCWIFLPRSVPQKVSGPIDLLGGVLFAPSISALLIALSYGATWGWTNLYRTIPLFVGGLLALVLWGWHELRTRNPLIDLRLLARPRVALANLGMCGFALAFQQHMLFLLLNQPTGTGVGFGLDPAVSGFLAAPGPLLGLALTPMIASAASKLGSRPVLIAGGLVLFASVACQLASILLPHFLWLALSLTLLSVASVCIYAAVPNVIIADVPPTRTSEATGLMQVQRSVAQASSAQIATTLLASSVVYDTATGAGPFPSYSAYLLTMCVTTAMCVIPIIAGLLLPRNAGLADTSRD